MKGQAEGQMSIFDLDIWSGKTYPEPSVQTEAKTSRQSSRKSSESQNRKLPMCLCLIGGASGVNQDISTMAWMDDGALLGEYTMLSTGEYPREENESRLSQILQDSAHPKYSLSAKACSGILKRAEKRGKELPKELKDALERQCLNSPNESEPIPSEYMGMTGMKPVDVSENRGGQSVVDRTIALEGNGQRESHKGDGYKETDTMYTLNSVEQHGVLPINTMVASRDGDEKRTTFGIGEPDDPQFTLSSAHEHAVFAKQCLNPWDVQSKHIQPENGVAESIYAGEARYGGGESYVMKHEPK